MKFFKSILIVLVASLILAGVSFGATVVTDQQIQEVSTVAQAGGDVVQAAQDIMAKVTQSLIAQGLTGEELQAQIAIGIQELTSGLDPGAANFEAMVSSVLRGATMGAVQGVNLAVGENPNLDPAVLTAIALAAASDAIGLIVAVYPDLNVDTLNAIVASAAEAMGLEAPEAYEPADDGVLTIGDDPFSDLGNPSPT